MAIVIENEPEHLALAKTSKNGFFIFTETNNNLLHENCQSSWNGIA